MGTIGVVLLVCFIIVCVLLVLLVAIQGDEEDGMGGLLGGRGTAAFGAHSASVLTKTTFVLVVLFFVLALGLALVNKKPAVEKDIGSTTTEAVAEETETTSKNWFLDSEDVAEDAEAEEEDAE